MNSGLNMTKLGERIDNCAPDHDLVPRLLAIWSAAVATAEESVMEAALNRAEHYDIGRLVLYEIILQSYLFLGFPRMLTAAEYLNQRFPHTVDNNGVVPYSSDESVEWFAEGSSLYGKVYAGASDLLKDRVSSFAPEIFRWMIIEGYGKVLSRPGLDIGTRELSIVAFLMIDNRPKQLFSHIKGTLNVGVTPSLVMTVINDIGSCAGEGYTAARSVCERLGLK